MKNFVRLPSTSDRSLKPWSTADEYLLMYLEEKGYEISNLAIFHDRFGYLTCSLSDHKPITIIYLESQKNSISVNATNNLISLDQLNVHSVLEDISYIGKTAIMKIPKSLDLFRLYLIKLVDLLPSDGILIASFMTRHFTKSMLETASEFFDTVEQSRAWKKSRLLLLSNPKSKNDNHLEKIKSIQYKEDNYLQYLGVFSANHIDYATQFLLDHIQVRETDNSFLDIGCGNGIIGKQLLERKIWEQSVMMDDSILATASAKMNICKQENLNIVTQYKLENFDDEQFDLVITNPPFHFEYEVDPSIAKQLMKDTYRILSPYGRLIIVANRHLNYKSHLLKWYREVKVGMENEKFIIYEAYK